MHGSSTFPKRERLQRGHQFRRVYRQGRKLEGKLVTMYVLENPAEEKGCGAAAAACAVGVVSGRKLGGAVARNRARRLLREAYRLNKGKLKTNLEIVMVARAAIWQKGYREVEADVLGLWRAAGILLES